MSKKKVIERRVGGSTADVSSYVKVKTASGHSSLDCNDAIARELRGATLAAVFKTVARALKKSGAEGSVAEIERELHKRYDNLNPGLARMSLGNRLRTTR